MLDRKLLQLLSILNIREAKRFAKFFESISENKTAIALLQYLLPLVTKNKAPDEATLAKLTKAKPASVASELKKHFKQLTDACEAFLAARQLQNKENAALRNVLLLRRLRHPKAADLFDKAARKARKGIDQAQGSDIFQFYLKVWLEHEIYFYPTQYNVEAAIEEQSKEQHIGVMLDALDAGYCLTKLRYACEALMINRLTSKEVLTPLLEEIISHSQQYFKEFPLFEMYAIALNLFTDFQEDDYRKLQWLVFEHSDVASLPEQLSIFTLLVNHTAHAMRVNKSYEKDALDIYRFGMTKGLLEEDGHILMEHFINYVNMMCAAGRTRSTRIFIDEYQKKLHPDVREQVTLITQTRLLMTEKKWKAAFELLYKKKFKNVQLRLMGRANRLVSCYEWYMNGSEEMALGSQSIFIDDESEAFRKGLYRMKGLVGNENVVLTANQNFSKMIRLLLQQAKLPDLDAAKTVLREELAKYSLLVHRKWLGEKIDEL